MSASLAPPPSGGCGTFSVAAWNICCGRGNGLTFTAKGLAKMGVGCAILSEMKITDSRYTRMTLGYKVLATKAPSKHQGGIALFWQPDHEAFEIEATKIVTPNIITFQLVTGDQRYYIIGIYIPPNDTQGGHNLRAAWEACPADCHSIFMDDLIINVGNPRDDREADIADLLDEINLVDTSRKLHFDGAASRRQGRAGRGVKSVGGVGYTPSWTTSWQGRGILGDFGRSASNLHQFTIPITARLLRTCGKGKVGPSRPIGAIANDSPLRSLLGSRTRRHVFLRN
jgi:hypothetical protein